MEGIFNNLLQGIEVAILLLLIIVLSYLVTLKAKLKNIKKMHIEMRANIDHFVSHANKLQSSLDAIQNNIHTRSRELDRLISLSDVTMQIMDKKINKMSDMNKA